MWSFCEKKHPAKIQSYHAILHRFNRYGSVTSLCKYTGLAPSHLIEHNNSCIYKALEIIDVCDVKFVNLKKFYDDLGLSYNYHIYIEKCKYFGPSPFEKDTTL